MENNSVERAVTSLGIVCEQRDVEDMLIIQAIPLAWTFETYEMQVSDHWNV